jgi:putative radical SAM enzyme (TIGR03279 family)
MIKIVNTEPGSKAASVGIRAGDMLLSINKSDVRDLLDYRFYQAGELISLDYLRDGVKSTVKIQKDYDENLGIELAHMRPKACSNDCIFCFIKQNPPGMRKTIYFCDEDYRYSFLHGNYITLTDLSDVELKRIVKLRLSPLYISVHATDSAVRQQIFRFKKDDHLLEKLSFLSQNRIELHTQVVLIPGYNDGSVLSQTVDDLYQFKNVKTLAIVPVGLTNYRTGLTQLQPVTAEQANNLIRQLKSWNRHYRNSDGDPFVYLADEFFLLANEPLPPAKQYGMYYQLENGVGLTRQFLDNFKKQVPFLPKAVNESRKILLITGELAAPILERHLLPVLNSIDNLTVEICPIINNFYGDTVSVAGLLTGGDIIEQFPKSKHYDQVLLPPRCVNEDGILLDDLTPDDIQNALLRTVSVGNDNFVEILKNA